MSRLFRISLLVLLIFATPVLLFFLVSTIVSSWEGAVTGYVLGVVYLVLVLWLLSRSPMWPDSQGAGWKWVAAALVWGGGVSFTLTMISALPITVITDRLALQVVSASFGGAYPEEISKVLGVGVLLFAFPALSRPWHGLMTGAVIGLGFEVTENILYGSFGAVLHPDADFPGALETWAARLIVGPGLHIIFSALAGWGLGLAVFTAGRSRAWRWGVACGWVFVAFALHFSWNLTWSRTSWQIATLIIVALIMYPLFIRVWVRAHRAARADTSYSYSPTLVTSVTPG